MAEEEYAKYALRERLPSAARAALLVIDMQEYFRGIGAPILLAINRFIAMARREGVPVIYTRHSHKDPSDYGMLGEWWNNNLIHDGTPEAELLPEVDRRESDKLVEKHTYSGFYNTDLEPHLRKLGRTEVIVTGVMTNLCCETTARDAYLRGFRVFFANDATATSNPDLHNATLKNMAYGFAYLLDSNKLKFDS